MEINLDTIEYLYEQCEYIFKVVFDREPTREEREGFVIGWTTCRDTMIQQINKIKS